MTAQSFFNLYDHGFIRAAVCIPELRVSDTVFNTQKTIELAQKADRQNAALVVFPELGVTAYSNEDLFHQEALLESTEASLMAIKEASAKLKPVLAVGAPLRFHCRLFNCAVIIHRGQILGIAVILSSELPRVLRGQTIFPGFGGPPFLRNSGRSKKYPFRFQPYFSGRQLESFQRFF